MLTQDASGWASTAAIICPTSCLSCRDGTWSSSTRTAPRCRPWLPQTPANALTLCRAASRMRTRTSLRRIRYADRQNACHGRFSYAEQGVFVMVALISGLNNLHRLLPEEQWWFMYCGKQSIEELHVVLHRNASHELFFAQVLGCDMRSAYPATLFRFPLRTPEQAAVSRISKQVRASFRRAL